MAVDRDETLKRAEELLQQGKLPAAIEEYVRLVEDRPGDWNTANALGDLYVKAGNVDLAAEQFTRVADHLFGEGFLPRASAVYKKVLKVRGNDDHALWQLAEIAGRNGVGVDARAYYNRLIKDRGAAGNDRGVVDCRVKLAMLGDAGVAAKLDAAGELARLGETSQAGKLMLTAVDLLIKGEKHGEAIELLEKAAQVAPYDDEIRARLETARADAGEPQAGAVAAGPIDAQTFYLGAAAAAEPASPAAVEATEALVLDGVPQDPAAALAEIAALADPPGEPRLVPAGSTPPEPLELESVFEELRRRVEQQAGPGDDGPDDGVDAGGRRR